MTDDLDGVRAMAPKTERIRVEVTDSIEGETRTFKIILMAPNTDFHLADLLRQRSVISPLHGELGQAVKVATQNYLSGAETLISTLTKVPTATSKSPKKRTQRDRNGSASELQQESTGGSN
jgi:predicted ATP-grasp superfamily ATP-dependent carboligase